MGKYFASFCDPRSVLDPMESLFLWGKDQSEIPTKILNVESSEYEVASGQMHLFCFSKYACKYTRRFVDIRGNYIILPGTLLCIHFQRSS
jgi:hypothetical protein